MQKRTFSPCILLPILATMVLMGSCKKETITFELPPATTTGENTIGAHIDYDVWLQGINTTFGIGLFTEYHEIPDTLSSTHIIPAGLFHTYGYGEIRPGRVACQMEFIAHDIYQPGVYSIDSIVYIEPWVTGYRTYYFDGEVYDQLGSNRLEITKLDTANNIICGKFELQLATSEGKVVNVTDGRFDLKYYPN